MSAPSLDAKTREELDRLTSQHRVLLFMKGDRRAPACGFSASVVGLLDQLGATFHTVDVLRDAALRDAVKAYSDWPTYPQLYVDGKLVGGADIVRAMHASGELAPLLGAASPTKRTPAETAAAKPLVTVRPAALAALREALADAGPGEGLRVEVSPRFEYDLSIAPREPDDLVAEVRADEPLAVFVSAASEGRADGLEVDYVDGPGGAGFKLRSPKEPPRVQQLSPAEARRLLEGDPRVVLVDVRTEEEQALARLPGARLLDSALRDELLALPRDTPLLFQCHHGVRSQRAAQEFLAEGFTNLSNLRGGIDAWSRELDPSVPRY